MAPRSFSEDGAFGAQSSGGSFGDSASATQSGSGDQNFADGRFAGLGSADGGGGFTHYNAPAGLPSYYAASFFADGGAIPDDPNGGDPMGASLQQSINQALSTVDDVLSYGRKLHGLGGGNDDGDDGGAIKEANGGYLNSRMPARPGTPSDSGVAPIQPMPGPLPPTSNPFGKRADASSDQDSGDDQSGAIDTDEETA